jgi:hypothetical protein
MQLQRQLQRRQRGQRTDLSRSTRRGGKEADVNARVLPVTVAREFISVEVRAEGRAESTAEARRGEQRRGEIRGEQTQEQRQEQRRKGRRKGQEREQRRQQRGGRPSREKSGTEAQQSRHGRTGAHRQTDRPDRQGHLFCLQKAKKARLCRAFSIP